MTLDLIITHYNEPYTIVRPMLQMLELQRKVRPGSFRVLMVNDGEEYRLQELTDYHPDYPFEEYSIPHGGVSAARNFGLEHSDSDWVMFCDCDDSFVSLYSMYEILAALESDDSKKYDLLWFPYYFEFQHVKDRHKVDEMELSFLHGKVFRRSFLMEKNLRFNPELTFSEDRSFLHVLGMEINPKNIGKINPNMPLYTYIHRDGSVCSRPENLWKNAVGLFRADVYLAEENRKHRRADSYWQYVCHAIADAYVSLCRTDITEPRDAFDEEAWAYYQEKAEGFKRAPKEDITLSIQRAISEFGLNGNQNRFPEFRVWLEGWTRLHESKSE